MAPLTLLLALLTPSADAMFGPLVASEDEQKLQWHCSDVSIVQGTVPWAVAVEARRSHARTFSAVSELENGLLPALAAKEDAGALRISSHSLFHVTRLPSVACGELASQVYDVGSYNMSAGFRGKRFAFFYSAAANYALVSQDWSRRTVKHGGGFILGHFYSFTAPLWGSRVINADDVGGDAITDNWAFMSSGDGAIGGISLDYIAGASADLDVLTLGTGYVGSQGFYLHADQPHSGVFLDSVAELRSLSGEGEGLLRYLKTGLSAFRWFVDAKSELADTVGASDVTYARYRVVAPSGRIFTAGDAARVDIDAFDQGVQSLTGLSQRNLWTHFDAMTRVQLQPVPSLYELGLRAHTAGYHADLLPKRGKRTPPPQETAASVALGMVNLPERTYFGVTGGARPFLNADVVHYFDQGDAYGSSFKAALKFNDPDTLIIFPYAQGATEVSFAFHIAM